MNSNVKKATVVTGATSGLGFEAALQLAAEGYDPVIVTGRTQSKADAAVIALRKASGSDVFVPLELDLDDRESPRRAAGEVARLGVPISALLLNAGLVSGAKIRRNPEGIEQTVSASLTGHHVFALELMRLGCVVDDARWVISGSEAARGDVKLMEPIDVREFSARHFNGDRTRALVSIMRAESPYHYRYMAHYGMTKALVAWWAAALARRLPKRMTINAVSPGSAPATGAMRHQSLPMKIVMTVLFRILGPLIGMAAPVSVAARRYLEAFRFKAGVSGKFFASVPGKMVGKMVEQRQVHLLDYDNQEATWKAVVELTASDLSSGSNAEMRAAPPLREAI